MAYREEVIQQRAERFSIVFATLFITTTDVSTGQQEQLLALALSTVSALAYLHDCKRNSKMMEVITMTDARTNLLSCCLHAHPPCSFQVIQSQRCCGFLARPFSACLCLHGLEGPPGPRDQLSLPTFRCAKPGLSNPRVVDLKVKAWKVQKTLSPAWLAFTRQPTTRSVKSGQAVLDRGCAHFAVNSTYGEHEAKACKAHQVLVTSLACLAISVSTSRLSSLCC
eukprot:1162153-Pelagomonas_calceolata.AAC.3